MFYSIWILWLQFIPECYKTQEICDKAVDTCLFVFDSVADWYKTQEMCDKFVSKKPFMLKMCDKLFISYLLTLECVPDWFATNKMLEKRDNSVFSYGDIFFNDADVRIMAWYNRFK